MAAKRASSATASQSFPSHISSALLLHPLPPPRFVSPLLPPLPFPPFSSSLSTLLCFSRENHHLMEREAILFSLSCYLLSRLSSFLFCFSVRTSFPLSPASGPCLPHHLHRSLPPLHILPVTVRPPDKSLQGQPNFEGQDKALAYGPIPRCLSLSLALSPSPLRRATWEARLLFCCRSPPSPRAEAGGPDWRRGPLFPLRPPRGGSGAARGGAALLLLRLNDVFHGTGRGRGKRTLPGLVGPAWHRHPRSRAAQGGSGGRWRDAAASLRTPWGKASPGGGRAGRREGGKEGEQPALPKP